MEFMELIENIEKRPALYLTKPSIYCLSVFLGGYQCAKSVDFDFRSFSYWIESKYQICNVGWHWSRILHHASGSEEKALTLFFSDIREYFVASKKGGIPQNRTEYGAPKISITNEYWEFLEYGESST